MIEGEHSSHPWARLRWLHPANEFSLPWDPWPHCWVETLLCPRGPPAPSGTSHLPGLSLPPGGGKVELSADAYSGHSERCSLGKISVNGSQIPGFC